MRNLLLVITALVALASGIRAQELDAQVSLNLSVLSEQERQNFQVFQHDLESYLNNYSWTTNFTGERIRCVFQINIVSGNGGEYTTQLFVSSTRPLYKSDQVTTMARFFDGNVVFSYYRGQEF